MIKEIPFSQLDLRGMFKRYNEEAVKRRLPKMRDRPQDRVAMGKALALLLATPIPKTRAVAPAKMPRAKKQNAMRAIIIEELCRIENFEHSETGRIVPLDMASKFGSTTLRSCGYSYRAVLVAVKKRIPNCKLTGPKLRVHAANIRNRKPGYEAANLPDRRPHSSLGVFHD